MEFIRKIGEFLKSHYEKVLLSIILLVLAAAAAYVPIKIRENRQRIEEINKPPPPVAVAPLKPIDLGTNEHLMQKLEHLSNIDLSTKHHLFNPVTWRQFPDGRIYKLDSEEKEGAGALVVTKITPLHLTLAFEGVRGAGSEARYGIRIERETSPRVPARRITPYLPVGGKADVPGGKGESITVRNLQGSADEPSAIVLDLTNPSETVTLTKEQPVERVVKYTADLKYELEVPTKNWADRQESNVLEFANGKYNIVAINENDVTVQDQLTGKRTTIKFTPARAAASGTAR